MTIIEDLKHRARQLHRAAQAGEPDAVARMRALPELKNEPSLETAVRRRHCLTVVARELGFESWAHLAHVAEGGCRDFGTFLYPPGAPYWNIWSASYEEARDIRREHGGYLLPYKEQFIIVDRHFVEALGLDPDDPDWERIGRDFVRPADTDARARLFEGRLAHMMA